ncbi:MAG: preprotein translocase subunit SecE [Candidatus Margulisbacteria bacterium]|nr:preprotein translocase subunit SecE [Candidatus Margulisiibacteriota bacterium]
MKIKEYFSETRQELTKVSWPNQRKVMTLVIVIFIILCIVSLYVFVVDAGLSYLVKNLERIRI